jgi:hypothetical protein
MKFSIARPRVHRAFVSSQRKHLNHAVCRLLRSLSARPDPVSTHRASGLGFVAPLSNPDNFVMNRRKSRGLGATSTPIPLMIWPPRRPGSALVLRLNQEIVHDFVLLFFPPCGPQLILFGHWVHRAEPTCLSTPRRPHRIRPFAPVHHLHQRKSNHNLHLKYSSKSQSTPCCQSLITPRSDHTLVLGRSGPH